MSLLVIAAHSARLLAELAQAEGHEVIALDLFGDADTRRASRRWQSIAAAQSLQIDGERTLAALDQAAREGAVGWIAGSGFEGRPELLEQGAKRLAPVGTEALQVRRVRDPRFFFGKLDSLGVAYPLTRLAAPEVAQGWLVKDAAGTGGWHIRHAPAMAGPEVGPSHYFQREAVGVPMSTTFLANGAQAIVLGHNRLIVRAFGGRPHVYCGAIGPVPVSGAVARELGRIVHALTAAFDLRGLCSLDFLLDEDRVAVLEINPRPPASLALYAERLPLIAAHLRACLGGELPAGLTERDGLHAHRIVYARRALALDERAAARLQAEPDVHDQPLAGARFDAGDPVFSLSAAGDDADALIERLGQRRDAFADNTGDIPMSERPTDPHPLSVNTLARPLVLRLIDEADSLGVLVRRDERGTTIVDAGIEARSSIAAGLLIAEICLGGLGRASLRTGSGEGWPTWLEVSSSQPLHACLASQYAGWSLSATKEETGGKKFFSLGSGPARGLAAKEKLFAEIGYLDRAETGVLVLESDRVPPTVVIDKILRDCGLKPEALTLILTPTSSFAGTTQVVARGLETALHKAHELGFDLSLIVDGSAAAPLPAPSPDGVEAMGRTNDAILYGGRVHLSVRGDDDAARQLAAKLPSSNSRDYGRSFAEIFKAAEYDFYKIDGALFAPAEVWVSNVDSGNTWHAGAVNLELLRGLWLKEAAT